MHELELKVQNTIKKYNIFSIDKPIIVGVSGGADSICLSSILNNLGYQIIIAHINHNLRGEEAKRDEKFTEDFAKSIGAKFHLKSIDIKELAKNKKISEEMAGREVRYNFFEELSQQYNTNYIAVAHNKNDSAETILINLIRGASLNGLKGIMPVNSKICRPLIEIERCDIERYLNDMSISYVTDSTNNELIYTRNIIRNDIIKSIKKINPNFINTLLNNADIIKEDVSFLDKLAKQYEEKYISKSDGFIVLDIPSDDIDISIKRRLIINAIEKCLINKNVVTSLHIDNILSLKSGKKFLLGDVLKIANNHGKLWFSVNNDNIFFEYELKIGEKTQIKEISKTFFAEIVDEVKKENNSVYINYDKINEKIFLRSRKNGDKFSPNGLNGTQSIKKYLINNKVPSVLRNKIPIISLENDEVIGIFPLRVDENYIADKNTKTILKIKEI